MTETEQSKRGQLGMSEKKFEITDITHPDATYLHRIRALRDIPSAGVRAGDLGGWVERESNLDQFGNAWVFEDARVFGNAWVSDNARVFGNARVCGDAEVYGDAWVYGNARVFGSARVSNNAKVFGYAEVYGYALVFGNAKVSNNARVSDNAEVYGNAKVYGKAWVFDDAKVSSADEVLHALVMGSSLLPATLHRTKDGHALHVGCWSGTVPEFRTMIESDRWVEATPEQIELRRPELLAFATMCEARIATWDTRGQP